MNNDKMWSISLIIIGIVSLIIFGSNILHILLPDNLVRILGVIDIIMLVALSYTSIKKIKK